MKLRLSLTYILILIENLTFSQNFKFSWQISPSFSSAYSVSITQKKSNREICIIEYFNGDTVAKRISKYDCDRLITFLNDYKFLHAGNTFSKSIIKQYFETKYHSDTSLIILNNDTIRKELLYYKGIKYDNDSAKYYEEIQNWISWTDGNNYSGEYISGNISHTFNIHSGRISEKDFELNKLVFSLISKYDKIHNYHELGNLIENDKPK